MTIAEKIAKSFDKTIFSMHREGLFYKCYNEDAMVFSQRVKSYRVNTKFVKNVGAQVLSLGFPISEVEKKSLSLVAIKSAIGAISYIEEDKSVVFILTENIKDNYAEFQSAIISKKEKLLKKEEANNEIKESELIQLIEKFDLANSTPMQAMVFIQELKNKRPSNAR